MADTYNKAYTYKGYNVKVKYTNEKSFTEFLQESIDDVFVPKILEEIKSMKKL